SVGERLWESRRPCVLLRRIIDASPGRRLGAAETLEASMVAKRFFYICAGLLCLALAYHAGANNAGAQVVAGNPVVAYGTGLGCCNVVAVTANGDVYGAASPDAQWQHITNIFTGPTPAATDSWGSVKDRYRK